MTGNLEEKVHECPWAKKLKGTVYLYRCKNQDFCDYKHKDGPRTYTCDIRMCYNMLNVIGDYIDD